MSTATGKRTIELPARKTQKTRESARRSIPVPLASGAGEGPAGLSRPGRGEGGADPHHRVAWGAPDRILESPSDSRDHRVRRLHAANLDTQSQRPELGRARGERHGDHRVEPPFWIESETTIPGRTLPIRRREGPSCVAGPPALRSDLTYAKRLCAGGLDRSSYRSS